MIAYKRCCGSFWSWFIVKKCDPLAIPWREERLCKCNQVMISC